MPLPSSSNHHLPPHLREVCDLLARGLLRLVPVTSGSIAIGGTDVTALGGEEMRRLTRTTSFVWAA